MSLASEAIGVIVGRSWYETPKYEITKTLGSRGEPRVEIRHYQRTLFATTPIQGDGDNNGFRRLANYIFGKGNERGAHVAMTTPVAMDMQGRVGTRMYFSMPSKYSSIDELPRPKEGANVTFEEAPARYEAVIKWQDWFLNKDRFEPQAAQLIAMINRDPDCGFRVKPGAPPRLLQYDPPWTAFFWRRTEISVEVVPTASQQQ